MNITDKFFSLVDCVIDGFFQMIGVHDIEDADDFEEVPGTLQPIKREKADKDAPNWYVGKIIDDGNVKCEVVSCVEDDFRIKILQINWERLGTYMDLGKTYPLLCCYYNNNMMVWEVDPDTMKRTTSQVLLAWEKDIGWTWDLDS